MFQQLRFLFPWFLCLFFENNRERRSLSEGAVDAEVCSVNCADMLYDCKTEACAANTLGVRFIHTVEAFAKAGQMFLFNTDSGILDLQANALTRFGN